MVTPLNLALEQFVTLLSDKSHIFQLCQVNVNKEYSKWMKQSGSSSPLVSCSSLAHTFSFAQGKKDLHLLMDGYGCVCFCSAVWFSFTLVFNYMSVCPPAPLNLVFLLWNLRLFSWVYLVFSSSCHLLNIFVESKTMPEACLFYKKWVRFYSSPCVPWILNWQF